MVNIAGQGSKPTKDGSVSTDETTGLDLSLFTPRLELSDIEFDGIISDIIAQKVHQDALDDGVRPRGLRAKAAAADQNPSPKRIEWEVRTFGKELNAMTIGDLVVGLKSEHTERRRACAEALKEESKSDLRQIEKQLTEATHDTDPRTAGYAQDCLDKAEVKIIPVPKL
jgi:hypothetical protein